MSILYISYDGLMEPLGQSQVFPYLRGLARHHEITLVSYEKCDDWSDSVRRKRVEAEIRTAGIRWVPLRYHKSPTVLATTYDVIVGFACCVYLVRRYRIHIVHARSYVSAILALALKCIFGTRFIFDMRGFWADEKVDGGSWRAGSMLYRAAKSFERKFLIRADVVISLTKSGVAAMCNLSYLRDRLPLFEVIPTCTDMEKFRRALPSPPEGIISSARFTLCYLGSVGTRYMFDQVLEVFKALREVCPGAHLLVINRGYHDYIRERMSALHVPQSWVEIRAVEYADVANELSSVDAGIFFYKPAFSALGTAPTRMGEFLACGIPCLANAGVGDCWEILDDEAVGTVLRDFDVSERKRGIARLLELAAAPGISKRCRESARRHFSLADGVRNYDRIYRSLIELGGT